MDRKPTVLDLFSGIGGFSLGLERAGFETIAFSEIEPFCCDVLKKHWPDVPIAGDIKNLSYKDGKLYDSKRVIYEGKIDLICGGFPCQPFSIAGRKKGTEDDRDLWPQMFRIIREVKPTWVIGENVANFVRLAFTRTKVDLESEGYTLQPFIIPACAISAPHRRDRVWIVANSDQKRCKCGSDNRQERQIQAKQDGKLEEDKSKRQGWQFGSSEIGSVTTNNGSKRIQGRRKESICRVEEFSWCKDVRRVEDYFNRSDLPKPLICREDDGFSTRVDRLKALGNAVVPQIPEIIGQAIINITE